ncbi:sensor histidine kinase [Flavisolibacter nicotianae]|uniref:sensor histidine kinase n=1 Tax=Flavisolibacter nicotianae TaxID=2364882 RepID=UPI000EADC823|nr:ATP-binding protein [Flavisolibacter nicotianae]
MMEWSEHMILNRALFDVLPGCFLILHPGDEFIILYATKDYLALTNSTDSIFGKPLFDVFPDNPTDLQATGVKNLTLSLREVMRTGRSHRMSIQRYDIQKPGTREFEMRYWNPLNKPVFNEKGQLVAIIHSVEEVTDKVSLRHQLMHQDQTTQQQITDAISTTQELERMEISRELHDNVNQILLTARLYIGRVLEKETFEKEMLQAGYDLLDKAVKEIKNISQALLSTSQEEESMTNAIETLLSQVMSSGSINIHKSIHLPDEALIESKVKVAVLRIVQEQLSNVIKHAEAKNFFINIEFVDDVLKLSIKDDGKGFQQAEKKSGLGFQNMKSRVAVMNGVINILSNPGDGCTVEVQIPLKDG